jgi:two-component system sensor histidine kinase UhpB
VQLPAEFEAYSGIVLSTDASNELTEAWSDTGLALAVLATFCTLVLGLVYWTLAMGLRPLQDLNVAFARVGRGDLSPSVAETGPIELAGLGHEFNQMVARLATMKLQNDRLNEQLTNVQSEERADIARELHDEIGPFLFAVSLDVSSIHQLINDNDALQQSLAPRLEATRDAVIHMQKHLKVILGKLKPTVLLDLGLAPALDNLVDFWKARHPNIDFEINLHSESFGKVIDDAIYRIVRESLSNALRHGHPSRIEVSIRHQTNDLVAINVVDNGGGLKVPGSVIGFGIIGMQERATLLGGALTVDNRSDGSGVIVTAQLPLPRATELPAGDAREAISS